MKVLVAVKRVIDAYVKIHVRADGSGVETNQVKMSLNPFDEIALEEAIRWREKGIAITEIIVVSIGGQSVQENLRTGLALGADRAIHVATDALIEPLGVAKVLKAIAVQESVDIILLGKQAIDNDSGQTGQLLAGLLDWPQATFASRTLFSDDLKTIDVTREVDGGLETLRLSLPCVITTDLRLNEPRYPSLPNIMKSKQKPIRLMTFDELGVEHKVRLTTLKVISPPARKPGIQLGSVHELVDKLKQVDKVIS